MEKWEYKVAYIAHRGGDEKKRVNGEYVALWQIDIERELNKLGNDGWEVVNFPTELFDQRVDGYALFKRRVESK